MKVEFKSVSLNIVHNFKLNEQLSYKAGIQVFVGVNPDGERYVDTDITEHEDIVFMGMNVENDYKAIKAFKENFKNMGIDIDKQMDAQIQEFIDANINVSKYDSYYAFLEGIE